MALTLIYIYSFLLQGFKFVIYEVDGLPMTQMKGTGYYHPARKK